MPSSSFMFKLLLLLVAHLVILCLTVVYAKRDYSVGKDSDFANRFSFTEGELTSMESQRMEEHAAERRLESDINSRLGRRSESRFIGKESIQREGKKKRHRRIRHKNDRTNIISRRIGHDLNDERGTTVQQYERSSHSDNLNEGREGKLFRHTAAINRQIGDTHYDVFYELPERLSIKRFRNEKAITSRLKAPNGGEKNNNAVEEDRSDVSESREVRLSSDNKEWVPVMDENNNHDWPFYEPMDQRNPRGKERNNHHVKKKREDENEETTSLENNLLRAKRLVKRISESRLTDEMNDARERVAKNLRGIPSGASPPITVFPNDTIVIHYDLDFGEFKNGKNGQSNHGGNNNDGSNTKELADKLSTGPLVQRISSLVNSFPNMDNIQELVTILILDTLKAPVQIRTLLMQHLQKSVKSSTTTFDDGSLSDVDDIRKNAVQRREISKNSVSNAVQRGHKDNRNHNQITKPTRIQESSGTDFTHFPSQRPASTGFIALGPSNSNSGVREDQTSTNRKLISQSNTRANEESGQGFSIQTFLERYPEVRRQSSRFKNSNSGDESPLTTTTTENSLELLQREIARHEDDNGNTRIKNQHSAPFRASSTMSPNNWQPVATTQHHVPIRPTIPTVVATVPPRVHEQSKQQGSNRKRTNGESSGKHTTPQKHIRGGSATNTEQRVNHRDTEQSSTAGVQAIVSFTMDRNSAAGSKANQQQTNFRSIRDQVTRGNQNHRRNEAEKGREDLINQKNKQEADFQQPGTNKEDFYDFINYKDNDDEYDFKDGYEDDELSSDEYAYLYSDEYYDELVPLHHRFPSNPVVHNSKQTHSIDKDLNKNGNSESQDVLSSLTRRKKRPSQIIKQNGEEWTTTQTENISNDSNSFKDAIKNRKVVIKKFRNTEDKQTKGSDVRARPQQDVKRTNENEKSTPVNTFFNENQKKIVHQRDEHHKTQSKKLQSSTKSKDTSPSKKHKKKNFFQENTSNVDFIHNSTMSGPFGFPAKATHFTDANKAEGFPAMIEVIYTGFVWAFKITYRVPDSTRLTSVLHGGLHKILHGKVKRKRIKLADGDYITRITGRSSPFNINRLTFYTQSGKKYGPFGDRRANSSQDFDAKAPKGKALAFTSGSVDVGIPLRSIAFHWKTVPDF